MPTGNYVEDSLFVGDLSHCERKRGVHVAEQEIDFVAVDQLAGLLHRRPGVAAGGILDDQFDLAAENSALGVDLVDGELIADQFVFAEGGVGSGQGIVHPDLDAVGGARAPNEGAGGLGRAADEAPPQQVAARNRIHDAVVGHFSSPYRRSLAPVTSAAGDSVYWL